MNQLTFTLEDCQSPERLERLFRRLNAVLGETAAAQAEATRPSILAQQLAPFIQNQLQAPGSTPLNLQSLLPSQGQSVILEDTHANRLALYPPTNYTVGTVFYETDRTVLYAVVDSAGTLVWQYIGGIHDATLANIVTGLGTPDAGFLFEVTDYDHVLQWTGSAWTWGPGEIGSGYYMLFEAAPNSIGASAWAICDGSTVARLNADGTTTNVALDNLTTAAYLKGSTTSAAVAAASGTVANTTATNQATTATNQNEAAHTHAVTSPTGAPSATTTVDNDGAGSTVDVGSNTHTHAVTSPTGAGSAHTHTQDAHTHTQDAHNHAADTLELRNKQARLYFRR